MNASIDYDTIVAMCQETVAAAVAIEIVEQTGSTNVDLLARVAGQPDAHGPILLIALQQTAGRGRAGRTWHSDGCGLTFSLAWPMGQPLSALSGLPLAIGVATAEVLAARGIQVALKWPNDVLHNGRKVAGMLIETVGGSSLLRDDVWVVIGIGINMASQDALSEAVALGDNPGKSHDLSKTGAALPPSDRNVFVADLLVALTKALRTFQQYRFAAFIVRWNALHAHAGKAVDILNGSQVVHSGYAQGVDAIGRLLLETKNGRVAVVAGDVSLRAVALQPAMACHSVFRGLSGGDDAVAG